MKLSPAIASLLLAACTLIPLTARAATYNWNGNGDDSYFDTPANWGSTTSSPGNSDTAVFKATTLPLYTAVARNAIAVTALQIQSGSKALIDLSSLTPTETPDLKSGGITVYNGSLTIKGGVTEATSSLWIGNGGSGSFTLTDGAAFTYTGGSSNFRLGAAANSPGNTVRIEKGSSLISNSTIYLGYSATSGGNTLTVDGINSSVEVKNALSVGSIYANMTDNLVEISNNAKWTNSSAVSVGYNSGAKNNKIYIHGSGSEMSVKSGSNVYIGGSAGTATNNEIRVADGASFKSGSQVFVYQGAGNAFIVANGAEANIASVFNLAGLLRVEKAAFVGGAFNLNATGRVEVMEGTLTLTGPLAAAGGSRFVFDLAATSHISLTGTGANGVFSIEDGGVVYIDLLNVNSTGMLELLSAASFANVNNETLLLGQTFSGISAALVFDDGKVFVNVSAIPEPSSALLMAAGLALLASLRRRLKAFTTNTEAVV
ncbi:MAG TPA: PEP-CTERM sorting domain-containing protein [Chthoniobacteraceae bacterium]|nr:PEP-CTERM sorting domain-containing protein [Chthoniobacteraceae bacterium]